MELHGFNAIIPLEIGDIIQAKGYANKYKIIDIIFIYSTKDKQVNIYLELIDLDINCKIKLPYKDYEWSIETFNKKVKEN